MKILSFGEIIWDVYPDENIIGGAPLNFAAHFAKFGTSYLYSAVGDDELGEEALSRIEQFGVKIPYISILSNYATGICKVTLDDKKIPTYHVLKDVAYDNIPYDSEVEQEHFDALCFGTLAQRNKTSRDTLQKLLNKCKFDTVFCDINLRTDCYYEESVLTCFQNADILKLSEEESSFLNEFSFWNSLSPLRSLHDKISASFDKFTNIKCVVLTCGENGSVIFERNGNTVKIDAVKTDCISTVGAGDSYGAVFLKLYTETHDAKYSALIASKVSSHTVAHKEAIPEYDFSDFLN